MAVLKMADVDLKGKRVLIRLDLNVPVKDGNVTADERIRRALPTLEAALKQGARVMVASNLGRPTEGVFQEAHSLLPVVTSLEGLLTCPVRLARSYLDGVGAGVGEVVVLENVGFNKGERNGDESLASRYADLCDVYVADAFSQAHRAYASTYGVAKLAPVVCAGPQLTAELEALEKVVKEPARPVVAVIGGTKFSAKKALIESVSKIADSVVVGGAVANTFLAAQGQSVGKSLYETDFVPVAQELLKNAKIFVPTDVYVATEFSETAAATLKGAGDVADDELIMDLGEVDADAVAVLIKNAGTVLWAGPVGVWEFPNFRRGTAVVGEAIADSNAFSVAVGGDTVAAIDLFGLEDKISHVSSGSTAALQLLAGKPLPVLEVLEARAK
ncbi:phosphoglycerate kinase [Streptomyces sp. NPDC056460]|uniref:phosphoglycerate kinase n=1 Tax=Streptomyces sp. NPDC056460 TaxID=3345825 RepID=UPI0036D09C33